MINNEKKTKFLKAKEVAEEFFDGKIYFYTLDALNDWAEKNMGTPAWKKLTK